MVIFVIAILFEEYQQTGFNYKIPEKKKEINKEQITRRETFELLKNKNLSSVLYFEDCSNIIITRDFIEKLYSVRNATFYESDYFSNYLNYNNDGGGEWRLDLFEYNGEKIIICKRRKVTYIGSRKKRKSFSDYLIVYKQNKTLEERNGIYFNKNKNDFSISLGPSNFDEWEYDFARGKKFWQYRLPLTSLCFLN